HGVGRAIPLILLSTLAILGINATKGLTRKKESIEKATGIMLIVIGAFLIINGLPEGHEWYEETFIHQGWNVLIELTPIPAEFGMDEHEHEHGIEEDLSKTIMPIILFVLIAVPMIWYSIQRKRKVIEGKS
ncbi:MAG: cytochrome C biogenesis protein, partial [Nitrosopumilaceae archaeon]